MNKICVLTENVPGPCLSSRHVEYNITLFSHELRNRFLLGNVTVLDLGLPSYLSQPKLMLLIDNE